jgi:hypothetical protein
LPKVPAAERGASITKPRKLWQPLLRSRSRRCCGRGWWLLRLAQWRVALGRVVRQPQQQLLLMGGLPAALPVSRLLAPEEQPPVAQQQQ